MVDEANVWWEGGIGGQEREGEWVMSWEGSHIVCGVAGMPAGWAGNGGGPPGGESVNTRDRGGMEGCRCVHG